MTAKSPKNRFRVEITYSKAISEIGSVSSVSGSTIEEVKNRLDFYINQAERNGAKCHVVITENLATYPEFNWVKIESYENRINR